MEVELRHDLIPRTELQKQNSRTHFPRAELRKWNFTKTYPKRGVPEVDLLKDIPPEHNCGSGFSQRHFP